MRRSAHYGIGVLACTLCLSVNAQQQKPKVRMTDANDAIHLMKPAYRIPYGEITTTQVKTVLDRVLTFLDDATPTKVLNKDTKAPITDYSKIDKNAVLLPGTFRITSYEWGVTYSGMLLAAETTGDDRYKNYVAKRFDFLADIAPYFNKVKTEDLAEPLMKQMLHPQKLDDAGAVCASMIKAQMAGASFNGRPLIDNYMDFIMNKDYRLADGTFARNSPQHNTVWLDDMYMSIPAIVNMGKLTGDTKYYDEAVKQMLQFADRMFVKEKGIYRHGWVEGMSEHPMFHWGRANGWAILTTVEVLDALPENYPGRDKILALLRAHVKGLTPLQSGEGFWHQLLDRNDSYLETSCTAIYTYCIAHAINKGWIDKLAYGPVAVLGWNAVSTKVNQEGEVEGTCVGTGMAFDPAFYYYRPVNKYAAHGYGPVLLAGGEMYRLLKNSKTKMIDNAVQF